MDRPGGGSPTPLALVRGLQVRPPTPRSPAGSTGDGFLTPGEIRRRLDAYLASPELSVAERVAALDYLAIHPEVAAADGSSPGADAVRDRAGRVLRMFAATGPLVPAAPEAMVRLRAEAGLLAGEVCRLLGVDPADPG